MLTEFETNSITECKLTAMRLKEVLVFLLKITTTIVVMFLAAALLEIVVLAIFPRFYSFTFTMVCLGVAGVFSGLFCYGSVLEKISKQNVEKAALYSTLIIIAISAVLFFLMAPLSCREYNWPVKLFAITQGLTTFLLWKGKFQ